jgi:ribosomal-protein-alanine N-acetyltransferase
MNGSVEIRPMAATDIDAVMAIAASLDAAPHWPRAAYEAALDPPATPQRIALVAQVSATVIGFAIASLIPPQAELETIAIAQSRHRCKGGSALLVALLRELESRQITEITLEVRASNLAAQAFYRSHSLDIFRRRTGYYSDNGEDAVIMRALLPLPRK